MCSIANFHLPFQFSVLPVYWPYMWISPPPALIEDTSLTVYFCSASYFFYYAIDYESTAFSRAAIREANALSTWNYTEIFSCSDYECEEFYQQNVTNFLVTQLNFTSLQPNTLYSLEFLGCLDYFGSCTVGDSYYSYRVNITTKPEGELNRHHCRCPFPPTIYAHTQLVTISYTTLSL